MSNVFTNVIQDAYLIYLRDLRRLHSLSGSAMVSVKRVFGTPVVGKSNLELFYLLAWLSMSEREEKWEAFRKDPEWLQKREASEEDGPIVASIENSFLKPTSFSCVK